MEQAGAVLKKRSVTSADLILSPVQKKLLVAVGEVRNEQPIRSFISSQLVRCTLPHSDPGPVEWWTRTDGNLTLSIRSGGDADQGLYGIPYGTIPRLLLFWLTTEATRTKSRRLELGDNLSEFMEALELNPSRGGKRGDAKRLREQMRRLFRATMSFTQKRDDRGGKNRAWLDMLVAEAGTDDSFQWWDVTQPGQSALWSESIILGERFYDAITASPVPTNTRALRALRNSSLLLDLYAWATHRAFVARKSGQPVKVEWQDLAMQLGADYNNVKEFARNTRNALKKVQQVYPGLKYTVEYGAVLILPDSQLAIPE
jgi:hypothetical protein